MRLFAVMTCCLVVAACAPISQPARSDDPWANLKANALFDRGEQFYGMNNFSAALVDYRHYLDEYPDLHRANDASFRVAQCLEAMGERVESADVYRAVGLTYNRSEIAAPAFLRSGELYELEGFWQDALWDYGKGAEYLNTEAGRTASARGAELSARVAAQRAELEASRFPPRSASQVAPSDTWPSNAPNQPRRHWPPRGKTLWDIILGK